MQVNRVTYNVECAGAGEPLLLLHGFTGSAASWQEHVEAFKTKSLVITLDFLGHGKSDSPQDASRYAFDNTVADLVSILDELKIERTNILGYSMGGRVALYFAHAHSDRVKTLILESASPGIADAAERALRLGADNELADSIERTGIENFVEYWTNIPLFATQARLPETVRAQVKQQRFQNNTRGLAKSLRALSTGAQPSLWGHLSEIRIPTLLLAGALDYKFSGIAQAMGERMPNAHIEIISDAGHTIHLEQPQTFQQAVSEFTKPIENEV